MSRLIDELSSTIFYPRHFGVTLPSRASDYEHVPGVESSSPKFVVHYSEAYQRFCNYFTDGADDMDAYSNLSRMEESLADKYDRLYELVSEEVSLIRKGDNLLEEVEEANSISDISGDDSDHWTIYEVETQRDLPEAESPTVTLVESFEESGEKKGPALFVHFGSNTKYHKGPYSADIEGLTQATERFLNNRLENKARFEQKSAIVWITHNALEDVLFEYEVSGSVGHQEEFGLDIESPSRDETSGPGAKPIKDDNELEKLIEDAAAESEKDFDEMSNRALAKLLVKEFDAPYAVGTLRKKIPQLSVG